MIYLTAPQDLRGTGPYESCLRMLRRRYDAEYGGKLVFVDEGPAGEADSSGLLQDPSQVSELYVLAREDGTLDAEAYRRWEHLCRENGVPATLLVPVGESAAELGDFTVALPGDPEGDDHSIAWVTPEALTSPVSENTPRAWSRRRG